MRHARTLVFGLLTILLVGCSTSVEAVRSSLTWMRRPQTPAGPDVVIMDVPVIERPVGDAYINEELWRLAADELAVAPERKASLEDNGFRVGLIAGVTPSELLTLLTSKRSCASPRRMMIHSGDTQTLDLGPPLPLCRFQERREGKAVDVEREQAQCELKVIASLTKDGRTRLQFTPQLLHGETKLVPWQANADKPVLELQQQRPFDAFSSMNWEVTLAPNEWVVIGGRIDKPDSLGYRCFIRPDEATPVQRLLLIRTSRYVPGVLAEPFFESDDPNRSQAKSPPIALQAGLAAARGSTD